LNFLLDENVPLTVKELIKDLGHNAITLHDENKLGIKNGDVAELALKKDAIIITLDSDFLSLKKDLQIKVKILFIKIHPRDPKIITELIKINFERCIKTLTSPGKVILTKNKMIFEAP